MKKVQITTNLGNIVLELDDVKAPDTVKNFLAYVKKGFYTGTIFHRVIKDFMIQGGGFTADMKQKPTDKPILNEATNGLKNDKYAIAMARTNNPQSATAQFFINTKNNDFLNFRDKSQNGWGYCVFGKVVEGMDVVDQIGLVKTRRVYPHDDVPVDAVTITKVEEITV